MSEVKFHLDSNGEDLAVEHIQDVEDIIENNSLLRSMAQSRKSDVRHIASIPNVIIQKWMDEEWARGNRIMTLFGREMDEVVERKLKDPEWAYLRTDSNLSSGFLGFGS